LASEHTRGGKTVQPGMTTPLEAVAFDLDSTLCQYELTVEEVVERAIQRAGFDEGQLGSPAELAAAYDTAWWAAEEQLRLPTDELRRTAWGRILSARGVDEADATRLADAYSEIRRETGMSLYDGVSRFLDDLRARYRLGILTNGPSDMQWEKVEKLGLTAAVDAVVVAGDFGIFKPDPRPFKELLGLLDASPPASLFVGNSYEHDIVGARGVGMRTAWVKADGTGECPNGAPDYVVARATDLREVLL